MAAPTNWRMFDSAKQYIIDGTIDVDAGNTKIALFQSTATVTVSGPTVFGDIANEVAAANGYSAGGIVCTLTITRSGSTTTIGQLADATLTATATGNIVHRYPVLYMNATVNAINKPLLGYCISDSSPADVTLLAGNTMTIQNPAAGIFTITGATT